VPYSKVSDLPDNVKNVLPEHAQHIFFEAFNNAYDQYEEPEDRRDDDSREDVARKVAWNAVKQKYEKGEDGKWQSKDD
jgi:cation transport regulator